MRNVIISLACALSLVACTQHHPKSVVSFTTDYYAIDSTLDFLRDMDYVRDMAETKAYMDSEMGILLGYAAEDLWLDTSECPMLNWTADVLLKKANSVCPFKVDIAIQNGGGARAPWKAGKITLGDVFTMMPFDNRLVVLQLKGAEIIDLFTTLAPSEQAQGIAGARVAVNKKQLVKLEVGGKPVNPDAMYAVATSNYLAKGMDNMTALTRRDSLWDSGLLIRDIYVEAVQDAGTIHAAVDGRWTIKK